MISQRTEILLQLYHDEILLQLYHDVPADRHQGSLAVAAGATFIVDTGTEDVNTILSCSQALVRSTN